VYAPFTLVVVTWNSAQELPGLLTSIERHLGEGAGTIVVDNASDDATCSIARGWGRKVRLVELDENIGFGAANNIGIRLARTPVVIMLNPDTLLVDDSLSSLAHAAAKSRCLWGPELLNPDGTRQPSASPPPGGWELAVAALLPARLMPRRLRWRCEPWRARSRLTVGWLTGACVAASRDMLLELGPFDDSIHLYSEDLDLGTRAHAQGYASVFAPDIARVVHLGDRSSSQVFPDAGLEASVRNRRLVVRARLGRRRERWDFATQVAFHATRVVAKKALGKPTTREQTWLRTAARNSRWAAISRSSGKIGGERASGDT
jgi:N-acetylglucosaminyl-diphospho-decaprenol L-rhamnosyltransferase